MSQSAPRLELRVLGAPEARFAGEVLHMPRKGLALLCYLALEKRPVARRGLSEILWPGKGGGSLRGLLKELRKCAGSQIWLLDGDPAGVSAETDMERFVSLLVRGDFAAALRLWETGNRRGEGIDLGCLGLAHNRLGETGRAIECHLQALGISRELGDQRSECNHLANLANAYSRIGALREAQSYTKQALDLHRQTGDRRGEAIDLNSLGNIHRQLGQLEEAGGCYEQALALNRQAGERIGEADSLSNLGDLRAAMGEPQGALCFYRQAFALNLDNGDRHLGGVFLRKLAGVYLRLGDAETALALSVAAAGRFRELGSPHQARLPETLMALHDRAPDDALAEGLKGEGDARVGRATGRPSDFFATAPAALVRDLLKALATGRELARA